MLAGFWAPFEAALGAAGALTRRTVRDAVENRLDPPPVRPDAGDPDGLTLEDAVALLEAGDAGKG